MKVRKKVYPTGRVKWQADLGTVAGVRQQKYYDTKEEAQRVLTDARSRRASHGVAALALTESERVAFVVARDKLAAVGATIAQAVEHFLATRPRARESVPLRDLLDRCLAEKRNLKKSERYLKQLKSSCLSFVRGREALPAHTISRDEIKTWIHGNGWQPKTQLGYLGDLRTLFSFAVENGYAGENPCSGETPETRITLAEIDEREPETFTVEQVSRLLVTAVTSAPVVHWRSKEHEDFRPLITFLVLATYCGIRPGELERIKRSQISIRERHVVVEAKQAKTRRRRVVDLSENALRWLAFDPTGTEGMVCPRNFRRRYERLRVEAGFLPPEPKRGKPALDPADLPGWPHDVLRHTFASMHYAAHQNESLLKAQMGHSAREDVLFRHYRALKTRDEAARFWSLAPSRLHVCPPLTSEAPWRALPCACRLCIHSRRRLRE